MHNDSFTTRVIWRFVKDQYDIRFMIELKCFLVDLTVTLCPLDESIEVDSVQLLSISFQELTAAGLRTTPFWSSTEILTIMAWNERQQSDAI